MRMMSTRFWHKNRVGQVDTLAPAEALLKLRITPMNHNAVAELTGLSPFCGR
jgi:hypothetical protein